MPADLTVLKLHDVPLTPVNFFDADMHIGEIFVDDRRRVVYELVEVKSGSWQFRVPGESIVFFLDGRQVIENLDTGSRVEAGKGDVLIYPRDCHARVTYLEPVRALIVRWLPEGAVPAPPARD